MIRIDVSGDRQTIAMLRAVAPALRSRLDAVVQRLGLQLARKVKGEKLSGQVLKNRTGRLRRSINMELTGEGSARVTATVGTNVEYARIHEMGGTVQVKEHLRMQVQAWGRPMKPPRKVTVTAHSATFPARSFLRSALAEMEDRIRSDIAGVVEGRIDR